LGRALFLLCRCSNPPLYYRKVQWLVLGLCVFACTSAVQAAAKIALHSDTTLATAGYYQLTWSWPHAPADTTYSLIEFNSSSSHPNGHEIYAGPDLASVISGKRNGSYRYVVRAIGADDEVLALSNPLKIVVAHHSLARAWIIFTLGALVFISILVVVRVESVRHQRGLRQ
jgi:hypothetical protein